MIHRRKGSDIWPNFFIVGAPKAGTTSLYRYLQAHPEIFLPGLKEPHFFTSIRRSDPYGNLYWPVIDERHYLNLFRRATGAKAVGEASSSYLVTEEAACRIQSKVPKAKIIALLRDPIERAFSHYLMDVGFGVQPVPFYEAVVKDYTAAKKGMGITRLYVEDGLYYPSVKRYMDLFGAENVLVLVFEELMKSPLKWVHRTVEFLGLDWNLLQKDRLDKSYNEFGVARSWFADRIMQSKWLRFYVGPFVPTSLRLNLIKPLLLKKSAKPTLDSRAADLLRPIFAPDIANLEEILGRDLPFSTTKQGRVPVVA